MAKAVLTTKVDPSYDDLPEERYHFPRTCGECDGSGVLREILRDSGRFREIPGDSGSFRRPNDLDKEPEAFHSESVFRKLDSRKSLMGGAHDS